MRTLFPGGEMRGQHKAFADALGEAQYYDTSQGKGNWARVFARRARLGLEKGDIEAFRAAFVQELAATPEVSRRAREAWEAALHQALIGLKDAVARSKEPHAHAGAHNDPLALLKP